MSGSVSAFVGAEAFELNEIEEGEVVILYHSLPVHDTAALREQFRMHFPYTPVLQLTMDPKQDKPWDTVRTFDINCGPQALLRTEAGLLKQSGLY